MNEVPKQRKVQDSNLRPTGRRIPAFQAGAFDRSANLPWSIRQDSNLRHQASEACALSN